MRQYNPWRTPPADQIPAGFPFYFYNNNAFSTKALFFVCLFTGYFYFYNFITYTSRNLTADAALRRLSSSMAA